MGMSDTDKFSNLFLFLDGDHAVVTSCGKQDTERAKRPHRKSRNGCLRCKSRRVKCDERVPCGHCVHRREKCERPDPRQPSPRVEVIPQTLPSAHQVNTLHIELFYHFEKVTQFTLAFREVWGKVLEESFKYEYLMHAILAISAKHMSVLRPQDPRYAEAAIVLLNQSLQSFRSTLETPITQENCEARLSTPVLINYMAWTELGFLEGQPIVANPGAGGLDMAADLLFLLGSGVRHVFFTAVPLFEQHDSVFIRVGRYRPCEKLQEEADRRGTNWRQTLDRLLCIFDNPNYHGSPHRSPRSLQGSSPGIEYNMHGNTSASHSSPDADLALTPGQDTWGPTVPVHEGLTLDTTTQAESRMGTTNPENYVQQVIERNSGCFLEARYYLDPKNGLTARLIYERIAQRLAVLLSFIPEDGPESVVPLQEERMLDIERYFFSFPTLCFGPFLRLIQENDSRVLVVLYHTYRAANRLLRFEKTWWAEGRARIMEKLTLAELHARGLSAEL